MQATGITRSINRMSADERLKAIEQLQVKCAVQQLCNKPIPESLVAFTLAKLQGKAAPIPAGYHSIHHYRNGKVEIHYVSSI